MNIRISISTALRIGREEVRQQHRVFSVPIPDEMAQAIGEAIKTMPNDLPYEHLNVSAVLVGDDGQVIKLGPTTVRVV